MSEHYHDADCTANALESINEKLDELCDRLERVVDIYEITALTAEQRHRLQMEKEAEAAKP